MAHVLVVEDEPAIAESVAFALGRAGFEASTAHRLQAARDELRAPNSAFALVVLDLILPDGSGFDLIEELAESPGPPAVIVLSSRDAESDRVRALEQGADDYVTKPFSPREIVARVKAVLRRTRPKSAAEQPLTWDSSTRTARVLEQTLDLTRVEFDLLGLLLERHQVVLSRADIINRIWGPGFALSDRTIDSHIKALRRKLSDAGGESHWIETVRGIGYRISLPEHDG